MRVHFKYFSYVARHKFFVFLAGLKTGAPVWRLLIHDWSKFLPCEWFPYVEYFYGHWRVRGEKLPSDRLIFEAFDRAWLHHQHANPHHWQHWNLREDNGGVKLLEIPEHFAREMVADWMGAGRAITGKWEAANWYQKNRDIIQLAPRTRKLVDDLLAEVTR